MEKVGREGGAIWVLELRGRAREEAGGDFGDFGEVLFGSSDWTELGAAVFDILMEARLWAKVDPVLTLLSARPRGRLVEGVVDAGAGPRRVPVCGSRVDEVRFRPDSSRDVNWFAMLVVGEGAGEGADPVMLSFEESRECVVAALPGARRELSLLGLGGGSIALRSSLLRPGAAVSSGIAFGAGLSSCEGLREKDGSRLRRFDILEVEVVSGIVFMVVFLPSPISLSLFMCSEGTSNIEVGRDRSP